jgi:hypothetical protein
LKFGAHARVNRTGLHGVILTVLVAGSKNPSNK